MNAKLFAIATVGLMMFSGLAVLMDTEDNDAVVGDGGAYSYTLTYHSDEMSNTAAQELQLTVDGMTPISHASGTTTLSSLANEGSWGFNTTTGIGPFNSFYAAFDMNDGNKFVSILNPYDLTKKIDGTSLDDMSNYNIMWVLPTVYWSVTGNSVTLTNNPDAGGIAYGHTIDGQVRQYVAYGVYEGASATIGGQTVITSQSGVTPTSTSYSTYSNANNWAMDDSLAASNGTPAYSMNLTFSQLVLFRLVCSCVLEGFNSQQIVGNGNVYASNSSLPFSATGLLDAYGPYAGNPADITNTDNLKSPVKLFIENIWGNRTDFVAGIAYTNSGTFKIDRSSTPGFPSAESEYVESVTRVSNMVNGYYGKGISLDPQTWGITTSSGSANTNNMIGVPDTASGNGTSSKTWAYGAGGTRTSVTGDAGNAGLFAYENSTSGNLTDGSSRLVFVYGDVMGSATVSIAPNDPDYGSVSESEITDIEPGDTIIIDGETITYGETTVTATANMADAQYTYAFAGWYDGDTLLEDGELQVDSSLTITAVFTATTNQYAVTISPNDPSYGSVSPSSLTVDYGTAITVSGTSLTIGSTAVTATASDATAQYTYAFDSWTVPGAVETVTGPITITGTFTATVNEYTVTIESADVTLGTVDVSEVQDVPYGTVIIVSGDTITIGETVITATVIGDGLVTKWSVSDGATVKGDMTITASFVEPSSVEDTLMKLIPFMLIIILVLAAVSGVFMSGGDPMSIIRLVIGITVGILVIVLFVLPMTGGL